MREPRDGLWLLPPLRCVRPPRRVRARVLTGAAGDLLRAEQNREGSEYGEMIRTYIREGQIVPMEVTIKLLENAMREALETRKESGHEGWADGRGRFLIDGFPRKMDQALKFEEDVRYHASCTPYVLRKLIRFAAGLHGQDGAVLHDYRRRDDEASFEAW